MENHNSIVTFVPLILISDELIIMTSLLNTTKEKIPSPNFIVLEKEFLFRKFFTNKYTIILVSE